jgi:hypothetical protein
MDVADMIQVMPFKGVREASHKKAQSLSNKYIHLLWMAHK